MLRTFIDLIVIIKQLYSAQDSEVKRTSTSTKCFGLLKGSKLAVVPVSPFERVLGLLPSIPSVKLWIVRARVFIQVS